MSSSATEPHRAKGDVPFDAAPPRVSVIMAVKDVEEWIGEAVESVLGQTLSSLELLVIDDGSTDGTRGVIHDYVQRDRRVRLLRNPGSGGGSARNWGIEHAIGEYLAFADGDDIVPRTAYASMLASLDQSGSEMVVGNYLTVAPQNLWTRHQTLPVYGSRQSSLTISDIPIILRDRVCWNRLISRHAWNGAHLNFEDSSRSNDIVAMVHAYCAFSFDIVPDPVYIYRRRVGPSSMTASKLSPASTRAHLKQESLSLDALERLADQDVLLQHYVNILEHDLWAHCQHLLDPKVWRDELFAEARDDFHEFLNRVPSSAISQVREQRKLAYLFARTEHWDFAAAVRSADDPDVLDTIFRLEEPASLVRIGHELAEGINGMLTRIFRTLAERALAGLAEDMNETEFVDRVRALRAMQSAGVPRQRLNVPERALITPSQDDSIYAARARIANAVANDARDASKRKRALQRAKRLLARVRSRVARARSRTDADGLPRTGAQ